MGGVNASTLAAQIEYCRPELELMYQVAGSNTFWGRVKTRTDLKAVSTRPVRIPLETAQGAKPKVANFDAGVLGRGGAPTEEFGSLSCVSYVQGSEYSALSEYATDSSEKAIQNYVSLTQQRATEAMATFLDAVAQGSGDNKLDTIVDVTTNGLIVNNANRFMAGWDIDVFSAANPPVFQATVTVLSVDIANNTVWLTGAVPAGAIAGAGLFVSGSTGAANTGLAGITAYQVAGNTGNFLGIARSSWPGLFSTPTIAVTGALTPAAVRACEAQIRLAIGEQRADEGELIAHCNVDTQAAWENNSLLVQRVIANDVKDQSVDMLPKKAPTVIAGRQMLVNERALPGRLDFLAMKHFFRIESKKLDYYEVGGQTVFPVYDTGGGLVASALFYLGVICNLGNSQPRTGAYMTGYSIPSGYFGN